MLTRPRTLFFYTLAMAIGMVVAGCFSAYAVSNPVPDQQADPAARTVGTVKTVSGPTVALVRDSGIEVPVVVQPGARILRTTAKQRDLKEAVPAELADIQAGDRMLVLRGRFAEDGKTILALFVVIMKQEDISRQQETEREEWRKHGIGGLVAAVDPAGGTVTVSTLAAGGKQTLIHVAPTTTIRRYAPDSIKFDGARPGTLAEIRTGDQLRARGTRNPEGTEFDAQELVSGNFAIFPAR